MDYKQVFDAVVLGRQLESETGKKFQIVGLPVASDNTGTLWPVVEVGAGFPAPMYLIRELNPEYVKQVAKAKEDLAKAQAEAAASPNGPQG